MACNAYNHPIDCDCGWGGDTGGGYKGYQSVSDYHKDRAFQIYWGQFNKLENPRSYTTPNAFCPVCGANVFFYQSENGGRVFFDELGPPWPKHPCTDTSFSKFPKPRVVKLESRIFNYNWQNEGWEPVDLKSFDSEGILQKARIARTDSDNLSFYLAFIADAPSILSQPIFVREQDISS